MALADIIATINKDAASESERILDEAKREAAALLEQAGAQAHDLERLGRDDAERATSKAQGRILAAATREAKFALQGFRSSLIERVFAEAESALARMPADAYRVFIAKRADSLPEKTGTLTVSLERKAETLALLEKAGIDTKGAGASDLLGGFILETKGALYDHSLRTVATRARTELAREVARELFGS